MHTFHSRTCFTIEEVVNKLSSIFGSSLSLNTEQDAIAHLSFEFPVDTCDKDNARLVSKECFFIVKKLLFKDKKYLDPIEICYINYESNQILHYAIICNSEKIHPSVCSFVIHFSDSSISVNIIPSPNRLVLSDWIKFILLPKLVKWAKEADTNRFCKENAVNSLKLISADSYNELYLHWRDKYGKRLIEKWTESTDPLKFVYEDIAIAAYLSLLWVNEKVNFIDLGCGNGLLVYILTEEGHCGRGIDIRARKIWSLYPPSTILEVGTVTPDSNCFFPDADWIIGNHSDELTPWIPVFAARSSLSCNFFLLPCCAYEFSGQRFQRRNSSVSVYNDYISYVNYICENLGFKVSVDRLRIPSTKRICIIGQGRTYDCTDVGNEMIEQVLRNAQNLNQFTPRESVEKVRNCTKIDRTVTKKICDIVAKALIDRQLAGSHLEKDIWSTNYAITFKDAVALLDSADLKKLRNECGGLQTVLRNNHSVFLIQKGRIFFRKPLESCSKNDKWKKRLCWFHHNHPMHCPLPENKCSFLH